MSTACSGVRATLSRMTGRDDAEDLARFGYRQELTRTLGSFSSFAATFSYLSILTGLFQMFYLGFGAGGPMFIWSWPLVLSGQFVVALGFAELAAHYPLSGGAYQWSKLTGSPRLGSSSAGFIWPVWWSPWRGRPGAAGPAAADLARVPDDWTSGDARASAMNAVLLGCGLIVLTTALNSVTRGGARKSQQHGRRDRALRRDSAGGPAVGVCDQIAC